MSGACEFKTHESGAATDFQYTDFAAIELSAEGGGDTIELLAHVDADEVGMAPWVVVKVIAGSAVTEVGDVTVADTFEDLVIEGGGLKL
jgi:hypothetical protein